MVPPMPGGRATGGDRSRQEVAKADIAPKSDSPITFSGKTPHTRIKILRELKTCYFLDLSLNTNG
jgi:hypothetical protein